MTTNQLIALLKNWAESYDRESQFTLPGVEEGALMVIADLKKVLEHQQKKAG